MRANRTFVATLNRTLADVRSLLIIEVADDCTIEVIVCALSDDSFKKSDFSCYDAYVSYTIAHAILSFQKDNIKEANLEAET